jgi:hypothetical protein
VDQGGGPVPVNKIIKIRKHVGPQFLAFRDEVDAVATGIGQRLDTVEDPAI